MSRCVVLTNTTDVHVDWINDMYSAFNIPDKFVRIMYIFA